MCPTRIRIALLAFGLAALSVAGLPALAGAQASDSPEGGAPDAVQKGVPKKDPKYYLWKYQGPTDKWKKVKDKQGKEVEDKSHKALHYTGKSNQGWRLVHPQYWNEAATLRTATDLVIYTITLDGGSPPNPNSTDPGQLNFCLYHCEDKWVYKDTNPSFQCLYDSPLNANCIEFRDCKEACGLRTRKDAMYFTVCKDGEDLYNGRKCCEPEPVMDRVSLPVCYPVPVEKHHCSLFDRIRSRRICR
ncbi:hypothetical protein [Urbifossiella limnaea]|uniref:Uncharacterized protein n=1 Tax=Urbifossiella limnaea TaxID=2528023 RepID=A0A517XL85_9BACT|nr:hypothetical protein [Urbifossiella limnaea]QDU18268.1 hypothetical protein ETAA1_01520 [Urbifossiella limnaea]